MPDRQRRLKKGSPKDPVCGKRMNRNKAYAVVHHAGKDYMLCCPRCQTEFEAEPERYATRD